MSRTIIRSFTAISARRLASNRATAFLRCPSFRPLRIRAPRSTTHRVHATKVTEEEERKKEELVDKIEKSLRESGMDAKAAQEVLKNWQNNVGHTVSPDDLRKVLRGQSTKAIALVAISTLLDAGAAYGAFVAGGFLGLASEQYGVAAIIGQALAYLLAGYYVTGAAFDFFKLGAVIIAAINFNINSSAFLAAVEGIAGTGTGLNVADKVLEAVNSVKILQAINTMSDLLKEQSKTGNASSSGDMLADLGAYLVLDKAERVYGFDATKFGLTEPEAAEIAVVFSQFDLSKWEIQFSSHRLTNPCTTSSSFTHDGSDV